MDQIQMETDNLCQNAAALFRARDKLARQMADVDRKLAQTRNEYRDAMRLKGFSVDHLRRACVARGLLL